MTQVKLCVCESESEYAMSRYEFCCKIDGMLSRLYDVVEDIEGGGGGGADVYGDASELYEASTDHVPGGLVHTIQ